MITLRKFEVPAYLRKSDFYQSLSEEEDDEFAIPANCFKADSNITDEESFRNLLSTLRFWGVESTPHTVFYVAMFTDCYYVDFLAEEFGAELTDLNVINTVSKHHAWQRYWAREATTHGELELLKYLHTILHFRHESPKDSLCSTAASNGHLHCLKYLHGAMEDHELVRYDPTSICSSAIYGGGHYDCFVFAFDAEINIQKYSSCMLKAIDRDYMKIVNFLNNRGCKLTTKEIYSIRTARGVQIVHDLGLYNWAKHDMRASFKGGSYVAMFKMYRLGCPSPKKLLRNPDFRKDCACALVALVVILILLVLFSLAFITACF